MKLKVYYEENLPSSNYKTRRVGKGIEVNLPDDISKEDFKAAETKWTGVCETLVKNDIARHYEELRSQGQ